MDHENAPLTPSAPRHAKMPRTLSPKRVSRTYTARRQRIPFAPVNHTDPLTEQMDSLSLRRERPRSRLLRWMPKRTTRPPPRPKSTPDACRITAARAVQQLRAAPAAHLPVAFVRQARVALAAEGDAWISGFLSSGGYVALLDRLAEVLAMEWREEQHDDQLLHELLRAVVALGTHPLGLAAIEHEAPAPFAALAALLFSSKRPADLDTRRLLVHLWTLGTRLDLPRGDYAHAPSAALAEPCTPSGVPHILALLHVERGDTERLALLPRRRRPLRPYVAELQTLCAEFFWVFCHDENAVADYDTIDVRAATRPRVPSGMTSSVEAEAMAYASAHLHLLCTLLERLSDGYSEAAAQLAHDLHDGGLADVLDTLRKASLEYYPELHVELAHIHALLRTALHAPAPAPVPRPAGPTPDDARRAPSASFDRSRTSRAPSVRSITALPRAAPAPARPTSPSSPLGLGAPPLGAGAAPLSPCPAPVSRVRITSITSERSTSGASAARAPAAPVSAPARAPSPTPERVLGDVTWEQISY
ncbi:hypothetical protein MOBT1_002243 [Malassezia obtusa]|uniref:Formin GTPase-binding domain-containing protein n=1 Tax=Malassezia obtusa TaxID=76774 RepID=A0AAF0E4U6_9BASI|nr:hypothetical protein MOBT1_002243 [Malassezia obtusa]